MATEETIPQMRERIDQLKSEKQALEASLADKSSELRLFMSRDAFREAGYAASHGELFAAQNPEGEIKPEAVREFAQKYGLNPVQQGSAPAVEETSGDDAGEQEPQETTDPGQALGTFPSGGSRPGADSAAGAGTRKMTKDELRELQKSNPAAARQALVEGRVQFSGPNPFAAVMPGQ